MVFVRDSIYAIARICDRNSVWTDVCHTGGSVKTVEARIMKHVYEKPAIFSQ